MKQVKFRRLQSVLRSLQVLNDERMMNYKLDICVLRATTSVLAILFFRFFSVFQFARPSDLRFNVE